MRKTTKDDIFTMLVLILSAATSALIGWVLYHFGNAEVDDFKLGPNLLPFFAMQIITFKPWAYLLDYIFRLFEKK
jgi:hypothetical protein